MRRTHPSDTGSAVVASSHRRGQNSRTRPSAASSSSSRKSKQRLCWGLLLGIFLWQAVIFPWITHTSLANDSGADSPTSSRTGSHLRSFQKADGSFNQYPIHRRYLSKEERQSFHSTVHCVGETHNKDTAWMYRSCEFTNLCLDVNKKEFYLIESPMEMAMQAKRLPDSYISTEFSSNSSFAHDVSLALGGINPRWQGKGFNKGISKVQWFPKSLAEAPSEVYMLEDDVVLVPFHSFAAHNVGHLLWDDFLPIYTLLELFGWMDASMADSTQQHLLLRVDTLPLLYGTCEMQKKKLKKCAANFERFLPLMGIDPQTFSTLKGIQFRQDEPSATTSLVCAKHAVAGLGMLTDHGLKDHGWLLPKETTVQNTAKGPLIYRFRNYLLRNLNLSTSPPKSTSPISIVLSAHSSSDPERDTHFQDQNRVLSKAFPDVHVQTVELAKMSLRDQLQLVSQTKIFVTTCGGGSMTATVLPKGATLILYYNEKGGYDFANNETLTGDPVFLDWDLFNNMAHIRVHWLPIGTMNTHEGWQALMFLIRQELDVIASGI